MSGVILTATSSAEKTLAGISIAADIRDAAISLCTGFTLLVSSTFVSARYGPEALMMYMTAYSQSGSSSYPPADFFLSPFVFSPCGFPVLSSAADAAVWLVEALLSAGCFPAATPWPDRPANVNSIIRKCLISGIAPCTAVR
jgi:hypothetical protein